MPIGLGPLSDPRCARAASSTAVPPEPPWAPWLARAREDLQMAEALAKAELATWGVCYHAQQSLEKGLKALLVATGADPPRSHNLVRLNAAVDPPVFGPDDEDPHRHHRVGRFTSLSG